MTAECLRVRLLLERYAAGLNQAERLVLERHLTTCSQCREQSTLLAGLRRLSDRASTLAAVPRERLIARAIQRAEQAEQPRAARTWPHQRVVRVAFAVALAAALVVASFTARRLGQRGPGPSASHALERSRLAFGSVRAGQRSLALGDAIPEDTPLFLERASDLTLEHARVRAAEPSDGQWSASQVSFSLEHGALDVSVDPRPKRRFSVRTSRFAVEVLGTEFQVSLSGVRVSRGLVRVLSPTGQELARVAAGQTWQVAEPEPAAPPASAAPAETVRSFSAAERLALARHALATRELASAKQELASVLALHPSFQEQAEAHMLLGDWSRLSGDYPGAAREYLAVCERFRGLPLAESALFSAARAEASAGHDVVSHELLRQYLARYPNGQFRQQATQRIAVPVPQEQK